MRYEIDIRMPDGSVEQKKAKTEPLKRAIKSLRDKPVGSKAYVYAVDGENGGQLATLIHTLTKVEGSATT